MFDCCSKFNYRFCKWQECFTTFSRGITASVSLLDCVGDNFFYFGFGSNLLAARIRLQNPSVVFHTIARLSDYRLDFDRKSYTWQGASATITLSPGDHVWGVVWLMKNSDMSNLDDQEGVHVNIYKVSVALYLNVVISLKSYLLFYTKLTA